MDPQAALILFINGIVIAAVVGGYIWVRHAAPRAMQAIYFRTNAFQPQSRTVVRVRFHTYFGFLVYFVQQEHNFELPVDQAEFMLRQLHRFNLTWGLPAAGCVFIPILSWSSFHGQMKVIKAAMRGGFEVEPKKIDD